MRSVEVAIVGGGAMGCAIAWQLAARGVSCALVERADFGAGASGATAGVIGPLWHLNPAAHELFRLGVRSLELFPKWADELTEAGVNPEFQRIGILRLAFAEDEARDLRDAYRWQSAQGWGVEWLQGDDITHRQPGISEQALAAIYSPQEGSVRGQRLCDALAQAAGRQGASLWQRTEVTGLIHYDDRVTGIDTSAGPIAASHVVLAAGFAVGGSGRWNIPGGTLDLPVRGVKGQRILLRRPGFLPQSPVRNSDVYVVPRLDGNILVASTREEGRTDDEVTAGGVSTLIAGATRSFPSLADAAFVSGRAGIRPATPDGLPIIGPVHGVEGLTIVTGHDAVGIMLSPATAELVAQYLLDGNEEPLRPFSPGRFAPMAGV